MVESYSLDILEHIGDPSCDDNTDRWEYTSGVKSIFFRKRQFTTRCLYGKKTRRPCYSTKYMRGHSCHYVVLAHSAGDTECQPLNHEHSLYLPLRKTPEDTFRNTGKRPTQGRGVEYEKKITIRTFCGPDILIRPFTRKREPSVTHF